MNRSAFFLSAFAITACTSAVTTGTSTRSATVSTERIAAHIRTVSADAFLGRAPATRGEELTTNYIRGQLQAAGVQPGGDVVNGQRQYTQRVPLLGAVTCNVAMFPQIRGAIRELRHHADR